MSKNQEVSTQQGAPDSLLVSLQKAQSKAGYLSKEVMTELAESLDIPVNDVYGVASFYSFLFTRPLGRTLNNISILAI